jgi:hypothetical protein
MKKIRHIEKRVFFALLPRLIGNGRKSCPTSLYKHIRHLKCPLFASLRCPIFEPTRESPGLPRSSPKSVTSFQIEANPDHQARRRRFRSDLPQRLSRQFFCRSRFARIVEVATVTLFLKIDFWDVCNKKSPGAKSGRYGGFSSSASSSRHMARICAAQRKIKRLPRKSSTLFRHKGAYHRPRQGQQQGCLSRSVCFP